MDVRVGSFSDPEGLEGLAHFLGEEVFSFACIFQLQSLELVMDVKVP